MIKIRKIALDFILGVSRDLHPKEFAGILREKDGMIHEVLVLPSSIWGQGFAQISPPHIPYDKDVVGTVHSHPSENTNPSKADLIFFGKRGKIHIICGYPYKNISDLSVYDNHGEKLKIQLVNENE